MDNLIIDHYPPRVSGVAKFFYRNRAGSALTLNPHLHILALDGTYTMVNDLPKLRCAPKLEDSDVENLLDDIVRRVTKLCRRRGYLDGNIAQWRRQAYPEDTVAKWRDTPCAYTV